MTGELYDSFFIIAARRIARWEPWPVLVAAPSLLYPGWWSVAGLGLIALSWTCRRVATGRWAIPGPVNAPLALLVMLMTLGIVPSVDRTASAAGLWRVVLGAALYVALASGLRERTEVRRWSWLLVAGGPALAALALLGTRWSAVRLFNLPDLYGRIPAVMERLADSESFNPRVMGMALGMLFPLPLALALLGSRPWQRVLCGVVALVVGAALLLTQAVQALLGVGAALLLLLAWKSRWFLLAVPAGLGLLGGALLGYGRRMAQVALSTDNAVGIAVTLRLDMWARALAMIRDMPFTGIGVNTFPQVQFGFYPGHMLGPEPHAHNLFLQVALDGGIWALAALVWLLVALAIMAVRGYRRCADRETQVLILGLGAGVLSFVVSGCVDTLWTSKPVVLFWLLAGLIGAAANVVWRAEGEASARAWWRRGGMITGALWAASLLLGLGLASGLRELNLGRVTAQQAVVAARATGIPSPQRLRSAAVRVERVAARLPGNPHTQELLGSLYAWLGEDGRALEALTRRVALDAPDPLARYAPFEAWRRRAAGEGNAQTWDGALSVYNNWMVRFPMRAETYVQVAIVWQSHKGNPERATSVLQQGLDRGGQPRGLLLYARERVRQSQLP